MTDADEIVLADYDLRWPGLFAHEAARIRAALGESAVAIEHFGSTAVPGLSAKPIIDLLIAVPSLVDARREAVPILEGLGYAYWYSSPAPDRLFFVKGLPPNGPRTHHVQLVEMGVSYHSRLGMYTFSDRLLFRDALRADPDEARRYAALKRHLAAKFPDDREAYTAGKTDYIYAVTERARRSKTGVTLPGTMSYATKP